MAGVTLLVNLELHDHIALNALLPGYCGVLEIFGNELEEGGVAYGERGGSFHNGAFQCFFRLRRRPGGSLGLCSLQKVTFPVDLPCLFVGDEGCCGTMEYVFVSLVEFGQLEEEYQARRVGFDFEGRVFVQDYGLEGFFMEIRGIVLHHEVVGHGKAVRFVLVLEDERLSFEVVGLPYVEDHVEALLFQLLLWLFYQL